jgi:hypothetical protein
MAMNTRLLSSLLAFMIASCASHPQIEPIATDSVRIAIQGQIDKCVEATRTQNIDVYMDCIPTDWALHDESGAVVSREQLRSNALRDWAIIPRTLAIETKIDSLDVKGDVATVYTSQRWERLMLQRDGKTVDTVLTTQKHRETWRNTSRGWMAYQIDELGGNVWVNGKLYEE